MNTLFGGSLCLTDLIDHAKKGHSAFSKAQNGKVYCNILTWLNDKEDKFGNTMSHQLSSSKEMRDTEPKTYIGNSKKLESSQPIIWIMSSQEKPQMRLMIYLFNYTDG